MNAKTSNHLTSTFRLATWTTTAAFFCLFFVSHAQADDPTFDQVQTVMLKYCAGCHNADDDNGGFSVDSFDSMLKGGEQGNALTPGSSESSLMMQLIKGQREPKMPPEGEPLPNETEIELIADWINSGAKGPEGKLTHHFEPPKIKSNVSVQPVTSLAIANDGSRIAIGKFKTIEIRDAIGEKTLKVIGDLPGKVNSLQFIQNGTHLVAGTGIAGLYGEAVVIRTSDGEIVQRLRGHNDIVYSVAISSDENTIATSSYDRKSVLWNRQSQEKLNTLTGHNDAIFDSAFTPESDLFVTASADATVKVWSVDSGQRLDTRGEPLKEQYSVAISADGKWIVAAGEDNRIRKWSLVSRSPNQSNPLTISRFAHEAAIEVIRFHPQGDHLVTIGRDDTIKIWDTANLTQQQRLKHTLSHVQTIAISDKKVVLGSLDGQIEVVDWPETITESQTTPSPIVSATPSTPVKPVSKLTELTEVEPNNSATNAMPIAVPFKVSGAIESTDDVDTFRFESRKGQRWIIESKASRNKSKLDSHIAVLDTDGQPVPRVLLSAIRDSYFTFRGKNSDQTEDFRIHNWEEMNLNQLLYCNGEVVRLYHYPRGPDSGFNVYPNFGKRHGVFDTTPITHALHEPCYIVEAYPPGTSLPATGLPQFLLNYENDDDAERELGTDSRLTFEAPADGEYIVRIRDTRDMGGPEFKYELTVRPERPSFGLNKIQGAPKLVRGVYKKFAVTIDRKDNFSGPVKIEINDLPNGIRADGPVFIERNGLRGYFTLYAGASTPIPAGDEMSTTVAATATIQGKTITKTVSLGKITIDEAPKLTVALGHSSDAMPHFNQARLPVLEIRPGQTITAEVSVTRTGHSGRINFGKEDAALNLPFGVYVDNTGLNGVLIPPDKNKRTFFLTAEPWVQPTSRLIFLEAAEAGKPVSNPAELRVLAQ